MFATRVALVLATLLIATSGHSHLKNALLEESPPVVVAVSPQRSDLVAHEPLVLILTIRNTSREPAEVDLGADRKGGISVGFYLPDGTRVTGRVRSHQSVSRRGRITLAPGQSYAQSLVVNEWLDLGEPGLYRVYVVVDKPIRMQSGAEIGPYPITVTATVKGKNDAALRSFCENTLKKLLTADTYAAAVDAAEALSYVQDPIAVSYLREGFQTAQPVHALLANGLEKIGSEEAIRVLLEMTRKESKGESGYLKEALRRLAPRTQDPRLRLQIRQATEDNP